MLRRAQRMRRRCVSQRDRKIYGLDADMPQPIRRFLRPGATETAVFDSASDRNGVALHIKGYEQA